MSKFKATAYLRLSHTDDRSAESDSIANQRRLIEDYVVQHPEIELVSERIDDGYSGIVFERPAVQKLLDLVQKGAVNCIIVKDFSRFDGKMEPDEEAADTVRLIFTLAQQGMRAKGIVKALHEQDIPTPAEYKAAHGFVGHDISRSNGIWSESTVARILEDERYTGTYVIGKREVTEVGGHRVRLKPEDEWIKIPDHHSAIIGKELFEEVQALRPHTKYAKKNINVYPLRGKVFCGNCGHAMPRTSNKNHAYICRRSQIDEAAPCHGLRIKEAELEQIVYDKMLLRLQTVSETKEHVPMVSSDGLNVRIENCLKQKRSLYEQFVAQKINLKDYKNQRAKLDSELKQYRQALAIVSTQMTERKEAKDQGSLLHRLQEAGCLTIELADELINRVDIYFEGRVELIWK